MDLDDFTDDIALFSAKEVAKQVGGNVLRLYSSTGFVWSGGLTKVAERNQQRKHPQSITRRTGYEESPA